MLFFSIVLAQASPDLQLWAQGNFQAVDALDVVEKRREKAVQETLDASNIFIQALAASKLEGRPHICSKYDFSTAGNTMTVTCDDRPTIEVKLDGTATKYPKKDGSDLEIIADVKGTTVVQNFQSSNGGMEVIYQFSEGSLVVTKKIDSDYLGKPIVLVMKYQKK